MSGRTIRGVTRGARHRAGTRRRPLVAAAVALLPAGPALADPLVTGSYNRFGTPGLVDLPTAEMARDAEIASVYSYSESGRRTTLTFQIAPRLTGSFRYSRIPDFEIDGGDRYDRSFDLRFALLDEGRYRPALAVGLQDFVGTGIYSAEYLVATKTFGRAGDLRFSAGLGWGRLATRNIAFGEEGSRIEADVDTGGTVNFDTLFTGPVSPFAGLAWTVTDRLSFRAEYSSDAYAAEAARGLIDPESPWNLGIDYEVAEGIRLSAFSIQGAEVGLQIAVTLNPTDPPFGPGLDPAPFPVQARAPRSVDALGWSGAWAADPGARADLSAALAELLETEGLTLEAASIRADRAILRIRNTRWPATAQAIGRTARVMTRVLPASVETFTIVPVVDGVPAASVSLRRSEVERLETEPAETIVSRAVFTGGAEARPDDLVRLAAYPRFSYGLGPYLDLSLFDPDEPLRAAFGLGLGADLELAPGVELSGTVRQPLLSNLDEISRDSDSELPRVRSDFARYVDDMGPSLERLTLAHYGRPGDALYSRVTAGYLERMFAGVSGELLWKPVDSRLALGAELNYVQQRDFDDPFTLQDYDVATGHLSAYYDMGEGYYGQIDVGQYLAGDVGATFTLDRVFANGWRVGAFATFTDVPFEEFGEGSFDKGIRLSIPLGWFTGQPNQTTYATTIRPLTRDGGARLSVDGRLHDRVAGAHRPAIEDRAGRFWK